MWKLLMMAIVVGLAGCSSGPDNAGCPPAAIVQELNKAYYFATTKPVRDISQSDIRARARLKDLTATCTCDDGSIDGTARVTIHVKRKPAFDGQPVTVRYFVTLVDGAMNVVQKDDHQVMVDLETDKQKTVLDEAMLKFTLPEGADATQYKILVGLTLDTKEFAYLKKRVTKKAKIPAKKTKDLHKRAVKPL